MKTTGDSDRHVWAAMLLATGQADVFGAVRRSPRLHWSFDGARLEAEGWAEEMQAGPIRLGEDRGRDRRRPHQGARRRAAQHSAAARTPAGVSQSCEIIKNQMFGGAPLPNY